MKTIKFLTFAALTATLLYQTPITRADDNERGDHNQQINKGFLTLAAGIYKPVDAGKGPKDNLGLIKVNLNSGNYMKVKIYPVSGLPGFKDEDKAIGTFYVSMADGLCAYDLPGGSFSAKFTGPNLVEQLPVPPTGPGVSWTMDGTFKLEILEATGIYQSFVDGHIHMVSILKYRAVDGTMLEECFCHVHPLLLAP